MANEATLKGLFQALKLDIPLDYSVPADQALYVANIHGADNDPIDDLFTYISIAEAPNASLFTGHRGVGKSTELRRLAAKLPRQDFFVGMVDVTEYINVAEPISTETLLLTLVAALVDSADTQLGGARMENSYLNRFKKFMTDTQISIPEVNAAGAKVMIKQTPDLQRLVSEAIGGATAQLAAKVNAFCKKIVEEVRQHQGEHMQVVLIVDSLERLRVSGLDAQSCYDAIKRTFDTNAEFLKMDDFHVVYSVPPYLPFLIPGIGSFFGGELYSLPHIKVFETPTNFTQITPVTPCEIGLALMVESVRKRYPQVEQVMPTTMLKQLALASSGSMRDYFRLIRSACTKALAKSAALPLNDDKWINAAQQVLHNEMPLAAEDKAWLKTVRATHGAGLEKIDNLAQLARLFDSSVILAYKNGKNWCDAHYLLHQELAQ